ncbi:16S rRNA (cytosine(1402)-N(4))-methyltransferase RsmH [Halodesulfovibrio sp. MK-HDV]|jgi:16S rRNA (cytosine1402-N4)-methyltransferase|uniref:16S rRNA (cytosine(1402)-N(4))-methyltransferase RsmH n=1 Tax=unclassified Halodesulfovibrio TaxID=2644657 RepID=UPI00136E2654|nr:16S rRNA (cytosine(1402)-N(4))-methyltransferase RsmH [Halodesulfovibrio sp. MK-HDV]KAF1073990.1 Ribosomal RNA small subunit methyltransferase H [Halodesulfovibrio sp. MK-HDV]
MTSEQDGAQNQQVWDDHVSVLLNEVIDYLDPKPGGYYLDGTLGLAGHSEALLKKTEGKAHLLGIDRDLDTLERARKRLEPFGDNVVTAHARFSEFEMVLRDVNWDELDGALLDIGVSSMQIDQPERGFSFKTEGPLDMRMDPSGGMPPASSIVNKATYEKIKFIIGRYGEDPMCGRIAKAILEARSVAPIETTTQLASIVEKAYPAKWRAKSRNHPATRTFQALRMVVNSELEELEAFLKRILDRLRPGGRLAVITFHSLEDRMVKHMFKEESTGCICPKQIPVCICNHTPNVKLITRKPVTATDEERKLNSRSSSAKLRVVEKL